MFQDLEIAPSESPVKVFDYNRLDFLDAYNAIMISMQEYFSECEALVTRGNIEAYLNQYYPYLSSDNKTLFKQLLNPLSTDIFLEV